MERLNEQRPAGLGRPALRTWGFLFLTVGILSRSILQNQILGLRTMSAQELLNAMQTSETVMIYATAALVMQAMETCAIPIFAFLLTEGMKRTQDFFRYFLRVAGLALLTELPYNLAMGGKLLDLSSRNPVFGLVIAMAAIYFYQRYSKKSLADILVRIVVSLAAVLWCAMLGIEYGGCTVVTVLVLWLLWDKPLMRNIAGATVVLACSIFSLFLLAAPMSFLAIHFYNGEQGEENRVMNYLAYPALLLMAGLAGLYLL